MTVPVFSDASEPRERNRRLVLDMIRQEGEISRAEIARRTQLSRSTITNLVNELLPTGLIVESGTVNSAVGRRPILLRFQHDARALLGVDMGATHLTVVVTNMAGDVRSLRFREFPVIEQPDAALAEVGCLAREARAAAGIPDTACLGAGVAVPAPLEGEYHDRPSTIIMPKWVGVDIRRELGSRLRLPVALDNDANLGALSEKWWGHGKGYNNIAFIKVSTGVGCGLIINGSIFRGEGGTAGEIGHSTIDPSGPPCRCGLHGCLEAMIGSSAIVREMQVLLYAANRSLTEEPLTITDVAELARAGAPSAVAVVGRAGSHLGIAIANLLNLVNPGLIVLGGTLPEAGEVLLGPLRQTVRERTFSKSNKEAVITTSRLGEHSVAIGAATLVLERLFSGAMGPLLALIAPPRPISAG